MESTESAFMRHTDDFLKSAAGRGTRSALLGIFVNVGLASVKGCVGVLGNSFALGDGVESLADVLSGVVVYFGLKIAVKPPDANHPYGHGKAEPIAAAMNWAYGVEFLEIAPTQLGTDTFDDGESNEERQQLLDEFKVDRDKQRALHGNAVLSRYPIRSARVVPFTVGYDCFKESKIRPLEKAKRKAAVLIGEDLQREVRRGGRMTLYVDLDVPEAPEHRVTIACTHLENRTKPKIRRQQMEELPKEVQDIPNPVIIAGDMNTSGSDSTPTSVENMLYKRYGSLDFWTTKGIQWTTGVGIVYSTKAALKLTGIQYRIDPTSANIPGASPNLERGFFTTLEEFRFSDGKAIDFRGVPERTINGKAGTLADSNQRQGPGFAPTFAAELIWGNAKLAKFKLDWFFVKGDIDSPRDPKGSYLFAPHFPHTLVDLNNGPAEPIADHSPMTVDLPFHKPNLAPNKQSLQ